MAGANREFTPNQVFVGLPWKNVRSKSERIIQKLEKKYPLYFTIVGRDDGQDAKALFEVIQGPDWVIELRCVRRHGRQCERIARVRVRGGDRGAAGNLLERPRPPKKPLPAIRSFRSRICGRARVPFRLDIP